MLRPLSVKTPQEETHPLSFKNLTILMIKMIRLSLLTLFNAQSGQIISIEMDFKCIQLDSVDLLCTPFQRKKFKNP